MVEKKIIFLVLAIIAAYFLFAGGGLTKIKALVTMTTGLGGATTTPGTTTPNTSANLNDTPKQNMAGSASDPGAANPNGAGVVVTSYGINKNTFLKGVII